MSNRKIELRGYGVIAINPINLIEKEGVSVNSEGKPLKYVSGSVKRGYYVDDSGNEIPNSSVFKKFEIEGEDVIIPKLTPSKLVSNDDIEVIDDNSIIYKAIERKVYKVFTDSNEIKNLILDENKSLFFPLVVGNGYKIYNGVLTNYKGSIILVGVRGNFEDLLEKYNDDIVNVEIEAIPQNINKKKLLKYIGV